MFAFDYFGGVLWRRFSFEPWNEIQVANSHLLEPQELGIVLNGSLFQFPDHRAMLTSVSHEHFIKVAENAENMLLC